jgi:molybdenum cofactor synthesis domain-containing protein
MALIDLSEAKATVLAGVEVLATEVVAASEASGRVVVTDVLSPDPVPPFDNSAVDGFAVRSADFPRPESGEHTGHASTHTGPAGEYTDLEVVATIAAGANPAGITLEAGQSARIMTGAVVPNGADAIVMVEDSEVLSDSSSGGMESGGVEMVRLTAAPPAGRHIRRAGEDMEEGDTAVAAGTELTPAHVGLLATAGATKVEVVRRPCVGVISTGDELVADGSPLEPGQIRDSNRVMLVAMCREAGFEAVDLGLVADDEELIEAALTNAASHCDALITSGGVSMGDYDYVKSVLSRIGDMKWMQIAIKPAKPFAFGRIGECVVFGLPGNPVSSLVAFELLARPALRKMMGCSSLERRSVSARFEEGFNRRPDAKTHFVRVSLADVGAGDLVASPSGAQGSHQLSSSAGADGLAVIPDGHGPSQGESVEVILL